MPVLPAFLAAVFAVYSIANVGTVAVGQVTLGFAWTLLVAAIFAVPSTLAHLFIRREWNQNMVTGA